MGQVLHGCATTTEAVRRAIQHSQESLRVLAKRHEINPKTVAKWKKWTSVSDLSTGPKDAGSTVLTVEEEAVIAESTKRLLGGAFQLTPLGAQTLKGFEAPVLAWTVTGEVENVSRFEASRSAGMTPFVGREHEIALLLEFLPRGGGNGSLRAEAGYWERPAGPLHEHKRAFHAHGGTMN
jgi:hypothetical protein